LTKISFLKILGDKYKPFRRHLECRRHFDFSALATNFLQYNSASIPCPKIRSFHSAVPLPKNHEFLCKKSAMLNFSALLEFLRKKIFFIEDINMRHFD
jgi:hypothetical protein